MLRTRPGDPLAARTTDFLGLDFHCLSLDETLAWVAARTAESPFAYVVTPNVDHMIRLPRLSPDLRRAYEEADLRLCDSRVLARLGKLAGVRLTVAPGSDLTRRLLGEVLADGDTICLVGGTEAHRERLAALYPRLRIVQHVPPMGLLHDAAARGRAIEAAAAAGARVTLLAVGSPQQELIAREMRSGGRMRGTALCVGASVDFLVGNERRAPGLVQRAGLEWAWRLALSPRRLARRYLIEGPAIFPAVWRWSRAKRR